MTQRYRLVRARSATAAVPALDAQQRAVVDHEAGPLLVVAGPGTGKTTTLVEAVVDRIDSRGVDPERVLALTFSRRAAAQLRERITARLDRTVREPLARTFHSYAFGLVRREAARNGEPPPRLLTGPEQDAVVRELLKGDAGGRGGRWPADLRAALPTRGFAQELRDFIARCYERGVSVGALREIGQAHRRDGWLAAAAFLQQYEAVSALRDAGAYDPAELIRSAVALLDADGELARRERSAYDWIFVDEFQDTDPAQVQLLRTLAPSGGNLVVVGDRNQSIYAFRGADIGGIGRFTDTFRTGDGSPTPVIALTTNRRSASELVALGERVGDRLRGGVGRPSLAADPARSAGRVDVYVAASHAQEAQLVAGILRRAHLDDEIAWERMAVLVRSTRGRLSGLRRGLLAAGVPVGVPREEIPLVEQPGVRPLLELVRVAVNPERLDEALAVTLLTGPLGGMDALDLRRLRRALRGLEAAGGGTRTSGPLLVEALRAARTAPAVEERLARPVQRVGSLIELARDCMVAGESVEAVLWAVWSASGLSGRWREASAAGGPRGAAADRDLDAAMALFDAAGRFVDRLPRAGVEVFLDDLSAQLIPSDTLASLPPEAPSVALMTAHAAKGLEWEVVVVAGVQDGVWPDLRGRGTLLGVDDLVDVVETGDLVPGSRIPRLLDEERRLFYVACTRARERLVVTAVRDNDEGAQPSRFVTELPLEPDGGHQVLATSDTGQQDATRATTLAALRTRVPLPDLLTLLASLENDLTQPAPTRARAASLREDAHHLARSLDLAALVAELRATASDPMQDDVERRAAARVLARLADDQVPAAPPDEWYALAGLSDPRPLREPDETVRVSPSKVESFSTCRLRWLLEDVGANGAPGSAQGIGSVIHDIAELAADDPNLTVEDLMAQLEMRWDEVGVESPWFSRQQHARARRMVEKLVAWSTANKRRLVGAELDFEAHYGRAVLRGRVDRLEVDGDGRGHVVDFKTTNNPKPDATIPANPQLGAYQVAVAEGGFADHGVTESGGARLVHLGDGTVNVREQPQPALEVDAAGASWAHTMVAEVAEGMAGALFEATINDYCTVCPVRRACPLHDAGRQVAS
ncbi:MAG: ATP-dependent DNA helicase [Candidatus Nanopelagicales bacterium]